MFGRTLSFVNAGHNPPSSGIKLLNADGIALGVMDEIESVRSLPSKEIIEAVVWENTTFAGARPQFDDIVLEAGIGLEDKAGQPPASPYEPRRAFPE